MMKVGAMNENIILMKCIKGATIQNGNCKQTVILGNEALKKLAMSQDFKVSRHSDQILVYKAWHENGFV